MQGSQWLGLKTHRMHEQGVGTKAGIRLRSWEAMGMAVTSVFNVMVNRAGEMERWNVYVTGSQRSRSKRLLS